MAKNNKTKVLMVASEVAPLAKVGGLADVVGSLPIALNKLNCDARVIMPKYRNISEKKFGLKKIASNILIKAGRQKVKVNIWETKKAIKNTTVYLIEDNKFFTEKSVYKNNPPKDFLFFSVAVLESLSFLKFKPDIIHCHDFHTGLIPALLKTDRFSSLKDIKTLFTIHNLGFQGKSSPKILNIANLDENSLISLARDAADGDINFMVQGIINADLFNTVSPTYSKEVMTRELGAGLEKVIKQNKNKFSGILNGINIDHFNPAKDEFLKHKYSLKNLKNKVKNKLDLQKELGLEVNENIPLVGFIGRLYKQKGIKLITEDFAKLSCQFVFLGTGDKEREEYLKNLADKHPEKISAKIMFDIGFASQIYASSDILLVPSKFEPCGLIQMIAMRYGAVPVARDTGGLTDTINRQVGFKFKEFSSAGLKKVLKVALNVYLKHPLKWLKLQKNCMKKDFSWDFSARKYLTLYKKLDINK